MLSHFLFRQFSAALFITISLVPRVSLADESATPRDPYQNYNRHAYKLNDTLDKVIFKPVASAYSTILPNPVRKSISNFFGNLATIPTIANDLLQAKFEQATSDSWRLFFNTTLGIGGLFDIATKMGLPEHYEDLGLTLAHWGYTSSAYLVLPILGPSTVRDAITLPIHYSYLTVYPYIQDKTVSYSLVGLNFVSKRADLLDFDGTIQQASIDPYRFQRNAYLQRREYLMENNGHKEDEPDTEDDDLYIPATH